MIILLVVNLHSKFADKTHCFAVGAADQCVFCLASNGITPLTGAVKQSNNRYFVVFITIIMMR